MGGRWATTRWSVIVAAGGRGDAARAALEDLCRTYRGALVAFARADRAGRSEADAEDLTQAFLTELLSRGDLAGLDAARGSFRSWLLQSMRHFIVARARHEGAQKRGGGTEKISLDGPGAPVVAGGRDDAERLFHRRWAYTAVQRAVARVRDDVAQHGPEAARLFDKLKDRLLDQDDGEYAALATELGVQATALRARVYRWRRLVRAEIAETLEIDADVDREIEELIDAL